MIKSTFIYCSASRQKMVLPNTKPDFTLSAQQQQHNKQLFEEEIGTMFGKSPPTLNPYSYKSAGSPTLPHHHISTTPATLEIPTTVTTPPATKTMNTSTEEVVDSEEDEEIRVEEVDDDELSDETTGDSVDYTAEVVDNYSNIVQKQREGNDKRIQQMLALLIDSDIKYNLGKFNDCYNDCAQAEKIAVETNASLVYVAQAILGQGKAKFKLGETKQAQQLIHDSIALCNRFNDLEDLESFTECNLILMEAEHLIAEVDKMCFFESLIDFSFSNPLYQQQYIQALQCCNNTADNGLSLVPYQQSCVTTNNILSNTVRTNISAPKLITQQKFDSNKSKNSWQNTYLKYHRKQARPLAVKS